MHSKRLMMAALLMAALMCLAGVTACAEPLPGLSVQREETLTYAAGFTLTHYENGMDSFTLAAHPGKTYLLLGQGQDAPEGLGDDVIMLRRPILRATFNSTGMVSLMDAIGALDCIATVGTDAKGWYLPNVAERMEAGAIRYSGNYKAPDFEMLKALDVQLDVDTVRLGEHPEVTQKYDELGIPWLIESSSKEGHPLGRVEWVKLFGALFDRQAEAEQFFAEQVNRVNAVTSGESTGRTVAMVYMSADGSKVYCRNGGDYIAAMIGLAGGTYAMADVAPDQTGTTAVTMEEFYARCKDADCLFFHNYVQKFKTVKDMTDFNPLFADLKAVREGRVYVTAPDFTQSTAAIGGIIADMHTLLADPSVDSTPSLSRLK